VTDPLGIPAAKPGRWAVPFLSTLFAMLTLQMSSLGFSPLLPAIQKDFGASYSQIGLFTGLYGIVALALSYPAGILTKRFGEKLVLSAGLGIVAAGLLGLSVAPNFILGLLGRLFWLIGYRLAFICVMTAIAVTAPPSLRGSSMGVLGATSALASVIGAPFGSTIGGTLGWRGGIAAFAAMAVAGSLQFWLLYRSSSSPVDVTPGHGAAIGRRVGTPAYRAPMAWALALLLGCCNAGGFSSTFFVPAALGAKFGLNAQGAAYVISTAYIVGIFANLLCGYLMDRFDRWLIMGAMMSMTIVSALALTSSNLVVFQIAVALLVALGLAATNQVYGIAGEVMTGRDAGPVIGIVSLGAGVFGYIGPQLLGILRDWSGGFNAGWYFLAFSATVTLVEIVVLYRFARRSPPAYSIA
jgi:predicted MFS family arabinose efflux permease